MTPAELHLNDHTDDRLLSSGLAVVSVALVSLAVAGVLALRSRRQLLQLKQLDKVRQASVKELAGTNGEVPHDA